jgi:hypothetical protein
MKKTIYLLMILLMIPVVASAATISQSFLNDYQSDAIYLFIINDNVGRDISFQTDPVVYGGAATGWTTTLFDSESLVMQGTTIIPLSGLFDVTFWDNRNGGGNPTGFFDFSLEWAEYLGGAAVAQGSLYYDNGAIVGADGNFTSTVPTPVPASAWMLFSGLALFVGIRRHNNKEG